MSDPNRHSSPSASNNERSPNVEALFLLKTWVNELDELRQEITGESARSMRFIVEARAAGPATDITTLLLNAKLEGKRLDTWHREKGSFGEHGAAYYRGGLLYGAEFAQMMHRRLLKRDLRATDLDAYDAALDFVEASYSLKEVNAHQEHWRRTEARGKAVTGCDLLSVMSATLQEHFAGQIAATLKNNNVDNRDLEALHMGMIDATAFFWAYEKVCRGEIPEFQSDPLDYIPTFDPESHIPILQGIRLDAEATLRKLVEYQQWNTVTIPRAWAQWLKMDARVMLVQTGQNEFCYAAEKSGIADSSLFKSFLGFDRACTVVQNSLERRPIAWSLGAGLGMLAVSAGLEGQVMSWQANLALLGSSVVAGVGIKVIDWFEKRHPGGLSS